MRHSNGLLNITQLTITRENNITRWIMAGMESKEQKMRSKKKKKKKKNEELKQLSD